MSISVARRAVRSEWGPEHPNFGFTIRRQYLTCVRTAARSPPVTRSRGAAGVRRRVRHHQNWYSNPTFTPWAQKSVVLRLKTGAVGPLRLPPANWLGFTVPSICAAARPTVDQ